MKIATLEARHIAAIYKVAALVDSDADITQVDAARAERDTLKDQIRLMLPDFDRGYT